MNTTFNEHGVTTNPNSYTIFDNNKTKILVRTAQHENEWVSSFSYEFVPYEGASGLPSISDKHFPSEKEAFKSEIEYLENRVKDADPRNHVALESLKNAVNNFFPTEIQLSLF